MKLAKQYFKEEMSKKYGDDVWLSFSDVIYDSLGDKNLLFCNVHTKGYKYLETIDVLGYYDKHLKRLEMDSKINTILDGI